MFDTVPDKTNVPVPEPETITLPPDEAVSVPAPTAMVRVTVPEAASTSVRLAADRSTLLAASSKTVISVGEPVIAGSSFTPVMVIPTLSVAVENAVPTVVFTPVLPFTPDVLSQAFITIASVTVPFIFAFGLK